MAKITVLFPDNASVETDFLEETHLHPEAAPAAAVINALTAALCIAIKDGVPPENRETAINIISDVLNESFSKETEGN